MRKRHWYHCSLVYRGPSFTAARRVPQYADRRERQTPRLCACKTIAQCLAARLLDGEVFVYRTERPTGSVRPVGVWDHLVTDERWLVPPVVLVHYGTIPAVTMQRINVEAVAYHRATGKASTLRLRIEQYARASAEWVGTRYDRRRVRLFKDALGMKLRAQECYS